MEEETVDCMQDGETKIEEMPLEGIEEVPEEPKLLPIRHIK